jgi:hypothetical protein
MKFLQYLETMPENRIRCLFGGEDERPGTEHWLSISQTVTVLAELSNVFRVLDVAY